MAFSENIHPKEKWTHIAAMVWGPSGGSCFRLVFTDNEDNRYDLDIHYGSEEDRDKFVSMLKKSILEMEVE